MPIRKTHLERLKKEGYNPREIRAIELGTSQNTVAQVKQIRDRIREDPKLLKRFRDLSVKNREVSEDQWRKDRCFLDYNNLFKLVLDEPLYGFLVRMAQGKKKLKVLDEGAGFGLFLLDLKEMLEKEGIDTDTTAVVLKKHSLLDTYHKDGKVDHVYVGRSEFFLPDRNYDVIFSLYGGIHYTLSEFKKQILVKYASALNRGGVALIGADLIGIRTPLFEQMKIAFRKRGFEIKLFTGAIRGGLPTDILMIRRL
ncbi:MAG: class I SAM-dependent methyltransferase [Candidatus ainarchaeum sp.]|nr:class I SAM-dependent methyltransferase [Candidatus ainarchaeum sp.]